MKTFDLLKNGDDSILKIYTKAYDLWKKELKEKRSVSELADRLGKFQIEFEWALEKHGLDRHESQEVMVFSGLTFYRDESYEGKERSEKIREAFEISFCSLEVKSLAKRFSKTLFLGGY